MTTIPKQMDAHVLEEGSAAVEVSRFETSSGPRLRLRDLAGPAEIYLDPLELEGLTRIRRGGLVLGHDAAVGEEETPASGVVAEELFQNEFAMVAVGKLDLAGRPRLLIRDLASQAEAYLRPLELKELTRLRHRQFAGLLDPSELVAAAEPDPDQV